MNQEKVGKFIAEMRKEKKLTQEDIANHFGITSQAVSKWERGINAPDISILKELAQVLNVEVIELLNGEKINLKKENVNDTMINSIEFYENRTKKKYGKICYVITLFFFVVLSILLLFYGINNYNKIKVYTITSDDILSVSGKIMFNPKQKCLLIGRILYNDIYTGTDKELKVKAINIKIEASNQVFIQTGNMESVSYNEIKNINEYLREISITDMEVYENGEEVIKENDLNDLKIVLEYVDAGGELYSMEYPLQYSKDFSNTELFY